MSRCVRVDGHAAVSWGRHTVLFLPGRSYPGADERQCTAPHMRLVPYARDCEALPLVAEATENTYHVTCGVP